MPSARSHSLQYDRATIILHWTTVALIAVLWVMGMTIDYWPKGPLRVDYRSVHIILGVVLGCLLIARLSWRLTGGRILPDDPRPLLAFAAQAMHWVLYIVVGLTVALGVVTTWARGDSIFDFFTIPSFAPGARDLAESLVEWHELAANAVLVLAGLHAVAALLHHYVLGDDILVRMAPKLRR